MLRRKEQYKCALTSGDRGYRARREREAEAEGREMGAGDIQTNIQQEIEAGPSILPGADEEAGPLDLSAVLRRIKEVARVLDKFQDLREEGRSRSEYMEQVCFYFVWLKSPVLMTHLIRAAHFESPSVSAYV